MTRDDRFRSQLQQLTSLQEPSLAPAGRGAPGSAPRCLNAEYQPLRSLPQVGAPERHERQPVDTRLGWLLALGAGGSFVQRRGSPRLHRVYPTSGNLQSVQSYLIEPMGRGTDGCTPGARVWHYDPAKHAVAALATDPALQPPADHGVYLAFTSVPGRQAAKYGARGLRYSFLDLGHALAAQLQAARALGWYASWIECPRGELQAFLGLGAQPSFEDVESEAAGALLYLSPVPMQREPAQCLWRSLLESNLQPAASRSPGPELEDGELSRLLRVAHRVQMQGPTLCFESSPQRGPAQLCSQGLSSAATIGLLQRRTPDAFDARASLSGSQCEQIVREIEAAVAASPATALLQRLYFVHEVDGMPSGVYLPEDAGRRMRPLLTGSQRDEAHFLTAFQAKARDCSLLVLFATAEPGLEQFEHAHVRAGMLGQVACHTAAARGVRSSGLGAFFDEQTRRFLADLGLELDPIYWVALGHARIREEAA